MNTEEELLLVLLIFDEDMFFVSFVLLLISKMRRLWQPDQRPRQRIEAMVRLEPPPLSLRKAFSGAVGMYVLAPLREVGQFVDIDFVRF